MTVFASVLGEVVEGVGSVNEGFARDATSDEAGSTSTLAFDDDGLQTELSRANGSDVATWACADNEDLALLGLHVFNLT